MLKAGLEEGGYNEKKPQFGDCLWLAFASDPHTTSPMDP